MMKEFGINHEAINEKISQILIPQLLNYINRVKKRNELKVEIKRMNATSAEKDDEEDDEKDNEKDK